MIYGIAAFNYKGEHWLIRNGKFPIIGMRKEMLSFMKWLGVVNIKIVPLPYAGVCYDFERIIWC